MSQIFFSKYPGWNDYHMKKNPTEKTTNNPFNKK